MDLVLFTEGRLPVTSADGAGCGARGFGLVSRLPGASGLRPTGTTTRARGARWTRPGPRKR